jgi:hypothetical protein
MALSPARGAALAGFVPYRIELRADPPCAAWCRVGERRFREPSFEETIHAVLEDPFALVFQHRTPLDALCDFAPPAFGPEPAGFVFHLSRCGSTLVAQMLAALPSSVVLSEPSVLDALLRAPPPGGEPRQVALLRGLIGALGRPRAALEERLFVKLDSWQIHALPLLRRAFPSVPWVFLLRDPLEVLVSHRRSRGAQMIPGVLTPATAGLDLAEAAGMEPAAYAAQVLARACDAARGGLAQGGGLLVNYDELPGAVEGAIAAHFGLHFRDEERALLRAAARRDAKDPVRPFAPDARARQSEATPRERELCDAIARPAYEALEALRRAPRAPARPTRSSAPRRGAG